MRCPRGIAHQEPHGDADIGEQVGGTAAIWKDEEIADVLSLKLGTVRSRIHRGRTMLRKALAHRAPVAGRSRYSGPTESRRRPRLSTQAT